MDKTYAVWVKHKQGIREKRENKSESHISRFFKNESMSTIFICCITETNLIKIISAQLKNDSLSTSVVICA